MDPTHCEIGIVHCSRQEQIPPRSIRFQAGGVCNWSRTYLRESNGKPELYYWAGYKWFGNGPHICAKTPEELAERFSHEYLKQLRQSFDDGSVYETIKSWHVRARFTEPQSR